MYMHIEEKRECGFLQSLIHRLLRVYIVWIASQGCISVPAEFDFSSLATWKFRLLWRAVLLFWATWKERDIVVFEDTPFSQTRLISLHSSFFFSFSINFHSSLFYWTWLIPNLDSSFVSLLQFSIFTISMS